jgi:hypothetical protein
MRPPGMKHLSVSFLSIFTALAACGGNGGGDDQPDGGVVSTDKRYPDVDGDGYGDMTKGVDAASAPAGYIAKGGDCNDNDNKIHPGANEVCDSIDNNCDGKIDDADPLIDLSTMHTFYRDADSDGFGAPAGSMKACSAPSGYVASNTDCDDTNAAVNPSAPEVCDHVDNNCNGLVDIADPALDMSTAHTFYLDSDHDTYGNPAVSQVACDAPANYVAQANDCNDSDPTSHPNGVEVCDGHDNDCDGGIDGTAAAPAQCAALLGSYAGTYTHHTDERIGSTIINQMDCTGAGSVSLVLNRTPALQGTFACNYTGGLTLFAHAQTVSIAASVDLAGHVTGTITHQYDGSSLQRTYNVTGTQTSTGITLSGTGSWFPNAMSAVAWGVTFSLSGAK